MAVIAIETDADRVAVLNAVGNPPNSLASTEHD